MKSCSTCFRISEKSWKSLGSKTCSHSHRFMLQLIYAAGFRILQYLLQDIREELEVPRIMFLDADFRPTKLNGVAFYTRNLSLFRIIT
ncbi:hypothetical protein MSG28_012344 [Choristoneura fumiferana]|uniref:Uncharacterized protein n=1 Tax=Choristoneura fumiferana TaxID=7141 RepID=A0ACC0KCP9_CHOFU|nr:hypothetical protein MSG28_012344 [Choristoneura fumiferana]